jgi:putative transposase
MDTNAIAAEYRMAHWSGIIQEQQESGLSIKAYCKAAGFHENSFYYWQRKLREAACTETINTTQRITEAAKRHPAPRGWVRCEDETPEGSSAQSCLKLEINRININVMTDTNMELLKKVCCAVKTL